MSSEEVPLERLAALAHEDVRLAARQLTAHQRPIERRLVEAVRSEFRGVYAPLDAIVGRLYPSRVTANEPQPWEPARWERWKGE